MSKSLLISAFIGSENLGDEVIFKSIIDNLFVDKTRITVLSVNEPKTQKLGVKTIYSRNILNVIRGISNCDILLMGGGGIIQDQSSILNFLYFYFQLIVARFYKKPIILCFVGVGPIRFQLNKLLLKHIANSISFAIVRDEQSKNFLLEYIGDPLKVVAAHDPALNILFDKKDLPRSPFMEKMPYIVVSIRRWFFVNPLLPVFITRRLNKWTMFRKRYDYFITSLANDIDKVLDKHQNVTLIFVSLYDSEDLDVISDLIKNMRNKNQVILAKDKISELEYLSIVSHSTFVLGMRLHSLVLSAVVKKPFIALSYSSKVEEFVKQFGLAEYSIHVDKYDGERLQHSIDVMLQQAAQLEPSMFKLLLSYKENNSIAFAMLREKINSL